MKHLLFILFLLLPASSYAYSCEDGKLLRENLDQLKLELACTNGASLHDCATYLHPEKAQVAFDGENSKKSCELPEVLPVVPPVLRTLLTSSAQATSGFETYVHSLEEFIEHTRLHRARVKALGLELYQTHPELFQGLSESQVLRVLEAHDEAKMSAKATYHDRPFYRVLYENYGSSIDPDIVKQLNEADGEFMKRAMKDVGLDDDPFMTAAERARRKSLRKKVAKIEKIADLVDRGEAKVSVEEFGHSMTSASSFLKTREERRLARELEKKYAATTAHLEYRPLLLAQRLEMSRKLAVEEGMGRLLKNENTVKLSARAMAYSLLKNGEKGFAKVIGFLGTKVGARVMMAADLATLYFADMNSLACDGIGHHDWVKDPNCREAIGLTPRIIQLLGKDEGTEEYIIQHEPRTCNVIKQVYAESVAVPPIKKCERGQVNLMLADEKEVEVTFDPGHKIQEIQLGDLGKEASSFFLGTPQKVAVNDQGEVSEICYSFMNPYAAPHCYERDSQEKSVQEGFQEVSELVRSVNFTIQKGIAACAP